MNDRPARLCGLVFLAGCGVALASPAMPAATAGQVSPHHASAHRHKRHASARPTSPVASAAPASAATATSAPAPVPNEAVNAPIEDRAPQTSVAPSVFQLHYPPQGDGYTTGSSSQAMDDREAAKATGVELKVPLPQ